MIFREVSAYHRTGGNAVSPPPAYSVVAKKSRYHSHRYDSLVIAAFALLTQLGFGPNYDQRGSVRSDWEKSLLSK